MFLQKAACIGAADYIVPACTRTSQCNGGFVVFLVACGTRAGSLPSNQVRRVLGAALGRLPGFNLYFWLTCGGVEAGSTSKSVKNRHGTKHSLRC